MINKMKVIDSGDSSLVAGLIVPMEEFNEKNKDVIITGGIPAKGTPVIEGIAKTALHTSSFLSAASFQETTAVLTDAAISGKVDMLKGLKENVIIGKLIPAGTGHRDYSSLDIKLENEYMDDDPSEMLENEFLSDREDELGLKVEQEED